MKRAGGLMPQITDPENLRVAYYRARRGKQHRPDARAFGLSLETNLQVLRRELAAGAVPFGKYHYFKVYEKKERTICAAPFRECVAHHAIMRVCDAVFDRRQIADSYACRREKGTFAALDRARTFTRSYPWFLKLDVRKYFDSISHDRLKEQLHSLFKDTVLLRLLDAVIDSYQVQPGRGVPIGNLTSQYFANQYLSAADHVVKEVLRIRGYLRYMDDMILWSSYKEQLLEAGYALQTFIKAHLLMTLKPFCLNRSEKGLPCLGFIVFPGKILLDAQSRTRYRRKMKLCYDGLCDGTLTQHAFAAQVMALVAHTEHADSCGFRRHVLQTFG